jgi:replication factor C large subunit
VDIELPWAEKYRPHTLDEVIGNGAAVSTLQKWAASWENGIPAKRAVVLSGRAGIGKTSTALALASDLGWGVIELNASDARNEEAIRRVAGAGALNETFRDDGAFIKASAGGRKLIVLDEADNVFGREDKGGVPAITEMIRTTRQPVVLIVNDYYALTRRASAMKGLALEIKFQAVRKDSIEKVLRSVASKEGVDVAPAVITRIASEAKGDLRAALNDLEGVARGRKVVPPEAAETIGGRDNRNTAFGMVDEVLRTLDLASARRALRDLDESPDFALLWIEENVPIAYQDPEDLDRAFYYLSRADQMLGRTVRRQYFGLWSYASDLMSGGVALAKRDRLHGWNRYQFPSWLIQMGRSKAARKHKAETYGKLGAYFHTSRREVGASIAPYLPRLMEADFDLAVNVAAGADLDGEDIAYLLGKAADDREVHTIYAEARRLLESGASLGVAADNKRGARKGSMSLGEAVEAAQAAQAAEKAKKPARKRAAEKKEPEPAKTEPAPAPPAEETEPDGPELDPTKNKSLFDF